MLGYLISDVSWYNFMFLGHIVFIKVRFFLSHYFFKQFLSFLFLCLLLDSSYSCITLLMSSHSSLMLWPFFFSSLQCQTAVNPIQCIFHLRYCIFHLQKFDLGYFLFSMSQLTMFMLSFTFNVLIPSGSVSFD